MNYLTILTNGLRRTNDVPSDPYRTYSKKDDIRIPTDKEIVVLVAKYCL